MVICSQILETIIAQFETVCSVYINLVSQVELNDESWFYAFFTDYQGDKITFWSVLDFLDL